MGDVGGEIAESKLVAFGLYGLAEDLRRDWCLVRVSTRLLDLARSCGRIHVDLGSLSSRLPGLPKRRQLTGKTPSSFLMTRCEFSALFESPVLPNWQWQPKRS